MEGVRMNLGLMKRHRYPSENGTNGEDEEMELNLGLSMNGRFGVDPASRKKLKRSSSISNLVFTVGAVDNAHARGAAFKSYAPLTRTRSLPTETEEEWRRRKEARKKRMEKMKSVRVVIKDNNENGSVNVERILSQGSIGSGSSGSSDLDNNHQIIEGSKQQTVAKTPPNGEQESANGDVNQSLKTTAIMDMPHVMTKQDGPNGSKVEGFLYRYKKGEEVKIVCVCHGMFLSPAEFVKHGGGGADVDQPLKHIVVNPFPIS